MNLAVKLLNNNRIGPDGAKALAEDLKHCSSLNFGPEYTEAWFDRFLFPNNTQKIFCYSNIKSVI